MGEMEAILKNLIWQPCAYDFVRSALINYLFAFLVICFSLFYVSFFNVLYSLFIYFMYKMQRLALLLAAAANRC